MKTEADKMAEFVLNNYLNSDEMGVSCTYDIETGVFFELIMESQFEIECDSENGHDHTIEADSWNDVRQDLFKRIHELEHLHRISPVLRLTHYKKNSLATRIVNGEPVSN